VWRGGQCWVCSASPVTCEIGPFPRFTGKREPQLDGGPGRAGLETHTSGQASGAEETLRGLTSPGKTTVRQEIHRQGWLALDFRTRVLAPFPLGAINQDKENPHDTQPAYLRHFRPSRQSKPHGLCPHQPDSHRGQAPDNWSQYHLLSEPDCLV